jgi:hypothetical protein
MDNIKNDYGLDMSKLVNQLRVKAAVIEMGESIAWGSDTALMRDAADRIEALEEVVKAVAHIGVDFGYGKYELQPEDIDKARALLDS